MVMRKTKNSKFKTQNLNLKTLILEAGMRTLLSLILILGLSFINVYAQDNELGKKLYDQWCAQCHGYEGDADAYATDFVFPKPRDFEFGVFKFRSTPTGESPTDEDIIRSIRKGNPGTSMPGWGRFSDEEVRAIVEYIKEFAPDTFAYEPEPIEIGKAPSCDENMIEKGKEAAKVAKCKDCHGKAGRGDGKKGWDEKFKDDWGYKIYPANYTHPWELRNGSSVEDIYRTITTGLNGTPMTSYQDSLSNEERWALACYITSLQLNRRLGVTLRVRKVETIPETTDANIWDEVDYLDLPLAGQIIFEPRHFTPVITNVRIRGVYTDSEIAVMLEWTDKKPNTGEDDLPPDGAIFQIPSKLLKGTEKPYFYRGDRKKPVNLWQWKASSKDLAIELNAKGPANILEQDKQDLKVTATYKDGLYRVIFRRAINTGSEEDLTFEEGKFIPFSVTIYEGQNREEGNRGAISTWYYMMLEPTAPLKVYILPPVVSLVVLGTGVILHNKLRRS
jgi:DMSO reductase family type II enzyme heme b subunit